MIDRLIAGRFRVTELTGRRGPVTIYEAIDQESGRQVLVKRIRGPLVDDEDFVANWRGHLQNVRDLDNGSVPAVLELAVADGELLQVESTAPGTVLRRYLGGHAPLPVAQAVPLVQAVAATLAPLHRQNLSHGALNPGSIWIEQDDGETRAFVADWELGEIVAAYSENPAALPDDVALYIAPEQIGAAPPPPTPTADVYALGVILYELLTGQHPFGMAGADPVLARLTHDPLRPTRYNPEIPPAVESVVLRALDRDRAERPPHAGALLMALRQALAGPAPAGPAVFPVVVERERVTGRTRPSWLVPALVAGAVVLLLLFTVLLVRRDAAVEPEPDEAIVVVAERVPNFVALPYDEARQMAERESLVLSVAGTRAGSGQPPNTILAQEPAAGTLPPATGIISVTVAAEPTPVAVTTVPNLFTQPVDVTEALLEQTGLRLGLVREAHSDLVPPGLVIEQNPRAGLQVPLGTEVDIIRSLGLPPAPTEVVLVAAPTTTVERYPPAAITPVFPPTETPGPVLPTATPQPAITLPSPTTAPTPAAPPELVGPLLFQDDFSTNDAGWTTVDTIEQVGQVLDGVYQAILYAPDSFFLTQPGREFGSFRYEADVISAEPQEPGQGIGLAFRVQDQDHFYLFEIDQTGRFRVRAREGELWRTLQDWTAAPAVQPGLATNRLAVMARDNLLQFEVNGEVIFETTDDAYDAGDIGLVVTNGNTSTSTGRFDNVRVLGL